jgi:hypothetical protein
MSPDDFKVFDAMGSNELARVVGEFALESELFATPPNDARKEAEGRSWYQRNKAALQAAICDRQAIKEYVTNERMAARITICAAVADVVAELFVGARPAAIAVAVMIVREGLQDFCLNS